MWSYKLQMTRGLRIWSQTLNRTIFDPLFDQKLSKNGKIQFWPFLPKRESNIVRFKFWDQICNPLVICNLYDHILLKLSNFDSWVPIAIVKISTGPCGNFFEFEIFDVRFRISVPKEIGGVVIALPRKWWSQPTLLLQINASVSWKQKVPDIPLRVPSDRRQWLFLSDVLLLVGRKLSLSRGGRNASQRRTVTMPDSFRAASLLPLCRQRVNRPAPACSLTCFMHAPALSPALLSEYAHEF